MEKLIRRIEIPRTKNEETHAIMRRQWLMTNGLGGYASGTISCGLSWRYHGLLIAALPEPYGRLMLLNQLAESVRLPNGQWHQISDVEIPHEKNTAVCPYLKEFRVENLVPIWRYEIDGVIIEKQILLLHGQNTVHVNYHLLSDHEPVQIQLRPFVHFRGHERPVTREMPEKYFLTISGRHYEISAGNSPSLKVMLNADDMSFTNDGGSKQEIFYEKEAERGYESRGILYCPGSFCFALFPQKSATFIASSERWEKMAALTPHEALELHHLRCERLVQLTDPRARHSPVADLVLAADQFIFKPVGRIADTARANATGDEVRTVIAGYHWFTDWGRDTMISLEGLTLTTGRHAEAGWILRTFARHIRDGLLPNLFPEAEHHGLYHTADATLWFFHAIDRYLAYTNDRNTLRALLPRLVDIVDHHVRGTRFGIHVDPSDGLLIQGAEGYQLTWMDAKVEDWVVTPRRGKAVEINALWYNALRLLENWLREEKNENAANDIAKRAQQTFDSFNRRFWFASGNYLYDVVDGENGNDSACRPNQVIAISLKHPVLDPQRWKPVLEITREKLLTPVGLRSLAPGHKDYKPRYFGDLRARDAAYHQGTVWAWLVGPFIDAWTKTFPDDHETIRHSLDGFLSHLNEACVGSISEIFDAEAPFTPRGCIAQAWSVAEVLRCLVNTADSEPIVPPRHNGKKDRARKFEVKGDHHYETSGRR
jgi:predicted glycogen debranching enzyme